MQTKPKKNSVITSRIPEGTEVIEVMVRIPAEMVFEVRNADGSLFADHLFNLREVHADNLGRAVVHGFNQRVPDAAAIGLEDRDGNRITRDERTRIKSEKINEVLIHYESGTAEWGRKASGDGLGARAVTVEAFSREMGCTYDQAKERIERRAKAAGRTYQKQLSIVREMFEKTVKAIEAERAARRPTVEINEEEELEALKQA